MRGEMIESAGGVTLSRGLPPECYRGAVAPFRGYPETDRYVPVGRILRFLGGGRGSARAGLARPRLGAEGPG